MTFKIAGVDESGNLTPRAMTRIRTIIAELIDSDRDTLVWPLPGTPATFPPSGHTHPLGDVTGLSTALAEKETPAGALAKVNTERDRALAAEATKADLVGGLIVTSQIPAIATHETVPVTSQAAMLALTSAQVQIGDEAVVSGGTTAQKGRWLLIGTDRTQIASWLRLSAPGGVQSVNGQTVADIVLGAADVQATPAAHATDSTNPHGVTKGQVGLGNVDNTSDASKPVSTAQAAAIAVAAVSSPVTQPSDQGFVTWSVDPAEIVSGIALTAGRALVAWMPLRSATSLSTLRTFLTAAGASLTSAGLALYDSAGSLIADCGLAATAFQTTGVIAGSFAALTAPTPGVYFAIWANGTTMPQVARSGAISLAVNLRGPAVTRIRYGITGTGTFTTATPPATLVGLSENAAVLGAAA